MNTKKYFRILSVLVVVVFLAALSACTSVDQLTQRGMGMLGGGDSDGATASSDNGKEAPEDSPMGVVDPTLTMLPPAAAFQIVYAQTAIFTGGAVAVNDFAVGEGLRWSLNWSDSEGQSDTLYTEQALLTRDASGEWWYISLSDGEYTIEYEYLITGENVVTELLYRDSDMAESRSATVNVPLDRMDDEEEFNSFYEQVEAGEAEGYDVTRRNASVTVPAGTFDAEVIEVVGTDPDTDEDIDSTWWRVDTVPGDTVQFEYRIDDEEAYQGQLQSYRSDYTRTL